MSFQPHSAQNSVAGSCKRKVDWVDRGQLAICEHAWLTGGCSPCQIRLPRARTRLEPVILTVSGKKEIDPMSDTIALKKGSKQACRQHSIFMPLNRSRGWPAVFETRPRSRRSRFGVATLAFNDWHSNQDGQETIDRFTVVKGATSPV